MDLVSPPRRSPYLRPIAIPYWLSPFAALVAVAWIAAAATLLLSGSYAFAPAFDLEVPPGTADVANPLSVPALEGFFDIVEIISFPALIVLIALALGSVVTRMRRGSSIEREQLKWFVYALGLSLISVVSEAFLPAASDVLFTVTFGALPVAIGIAILRHNLYDIDRIINRTLVYGLLTALLAAVYFGLVVGLQAASKPVSGGSDLAVALTTLIVAALFLPARQRVQQVVDRRFNRRTYDAAKTIEAFSARLRQNIDLDTLRSELLTVVDETMQPASVWLWLRPQEGGR